ncbi:MAG: hypothetical protein NTX16_00690 [Actinobacteria bacterium]|nr:hypothetical protein [Actinomycetota bacterium]
MRHVAVCGLLVIATLLAAGIGLVACDSSSQPGETPAATASARPASSFEVGEIVAAKWTDGSLCLATVTAVDGDNITVTYTDDGSSATLSIQDLRPIADTPFAVGDRVLAVWSGGRFYAGEVTKADGTTYTIKWDDGSQTSTVQAGKIIAE